ncbi:hypothetical protein RN001_015793 [Aquatica leii]|uniref:Methyltransferase domain-containing protein n=1 Tax=Aquatica leii TaxID=1421715 RepID=A0AAN7PMF9_9COLE|nr:hypothetical protein RN001_015793 [Aquatica leii]
MVLTHDVERLLSMCYMIYNEYNRLVNAYVSDFYVQKHWNLLPKCWRESLENLNPETLADIIDINKPLRSFQILPLSFLSLRQSIKCLSLPRMQNVSSIKTEFPISLIDENIAAAERFKHLFWKRIKLKKRHEIELIAKMCYKLASETQCYYIVDVGSGLGHLSRILFYKYGLRVCALEAQQYLSSEASKLDNTMENTMNYFDVCFNKNFRVIYLNVKIQTNSNGEDLLNAVKAAFDVDNIQFGIVGLHPCGDLGPTLLRLFNRSPQVKFINIVGCCYMKLSSLGYPLSEYSITNKYSLEYSAREVACHAIEAYIKKLKSGKHNELKIHAYRAILEKLIVTKFPNLHHSQVASVKCKDNLTFLEYCSKALSNLDIQLSESELQSEEVKEDLSKWKNVVTFYSLRLMIAPLLENIITLDRMLYTSQSGYYYELNSIFDPELSPRNQVFTAVK